MGYARQNHAYHEAGVYSYQRYYYGPSTFAPYQDCANPTTRAPGNLYLEAAWYHDGQGPCYDYWTKNTSAVQGLVFTWAHDVFWDGCNRGLGVYTWITMDTWQYQWTNTGWLGGFFRAATGHCHCP